MSLVLFSAVRVDETCDQFHVRRTGDPNWLVLSIPHGLFPTLEALVAALKAEVAHLGLTPFFRFDADGYGVKLVLRCETLFSLRFPSNGAHAQLGFLEGTYEPGRVEWESDRPCPSVLWLPGTERDSGWKRDATVRQVSPLAGSTASHLLARNTVRRLRMGPFPPETFDRWTTMMSRHLENHTPFFLCDDWTPSLLPDAHRLYAEVTPDLEENGDIAPMRRFPAPSPLRISADLRLLEVP